MLTPMADPNGTNGTPKVVTWDADPNGTPFMQS